MARSTFEGPVLAGDQRFTPYLGPEHISKYVGVNYKGYKNNALVFLEVMFIGIQYIHNKGKFS